MWLMRGLGQILEGATIRIFQVIGVLLSGGILLSISRAYCNGCLALLLGLVLIFGCSTPVWSQPQGTIELFQEDLSAQIEQREALKKKYLNSYVPSDATDMKVRGNAVEFSQDGKTLKLRDKVVASSSNFAIQADEGEVDIEKQEGTFSGEVFLSHPDFSISCSKAYLNVPYEVGVFNDAKFRIEELEFNANASSLIKYSELGYRLYDSSVTTCDPDVAPSPWSIASDTLDITEDGYANLYWASLSFYNVPVLYSPYIGFPVRQEKSSGLLMPSIGYGSQNGVQVWLPFHVVLDDATDLTLTPFIASGTRQGAEFEFRKAFSLQHNLISRWVFSDESLRNGELRGLLSRADGVLPFKEKRAGGFYKHEWSSDREATVPVSVMADIHYVNDDLMLRELEDPDIGFRNAPFLTSRIIGNTSLGSIGSAELLGEWNQAIDQNYQATDDAMLQRLPEANVRLSERWRPFGFNPYGLQLATQANISYTDFYRETGVAGQRVNINPGIAVPFHYESFFQGDVGVSYFDTSYNLSQVEGALASDGTQLQDSSSRQTYVASANISTILEQVYDVDQGSWLSTLTGLGVANYEQELKKVKHEIEPFIRYSFAPDKYQGDLPIFDALDRIRNRSFVTYGFKNRWIGKVESIRSYRSEIEEVTPTVEDLPELGLVDSVANLEFPRDSLVGNQLNILRSGALNSLGYLTVLQGYDFIEANENQDPLRDPFSDVYVDIGFTPNSVFALNTTTNYNPKDGSISSWTTGLSLRDDRGDAVGLRYSLVSPKVLVDNVVTDGVDISNIDGQLEFVLTERMKLGYYARYDQTASSFIDQIIGLRLANGCKCWSVDFGYSDRTNPDRQQVLMRVNLNGLGRLQQGVLYNSIRESLRSFQ
jgi:LPS-assembly protein